MLTGQRSVLCEGRLASRPTKLTCIQNIRYFPTLIIYETDKKDTHYPCVLFSITLATVNMHGRNSNRKHKC